jgi:hypothetical protein
MTYDVYNEFVFDLSNKIKFNQNPMWLDINFFFKISFLKNLFFW